MDLRSSVAIILISTLLAGYGGDGAATAAHRRPDRGSVATDGFGIYGNRGETGAALMNADLDACHGHTHAILWDGVMVMMYHYHATKEYPYTLGCYRGTPH